MDDKEATTQGGVGKRLKFRRQAQGGEGHARFAHCWVPGLVQSLEHRCSSRQHAPEGVCLSPSQSARTPP